MTNREIARIVTEAAKIRKDYPELSYRQAINKAKEKFSKGEIKE